MLTTVRARVLNNALHSLLDGKIVNIVSSESLDWNPYRSNGYLQDLLPEFCKDMFIILPSSNECKAYLTLAPLL